MAETNSSPDWIRAVSVNTYSDLCDVRIALVPAFVCSQQPLVSLASDIVVKLSTNCILIQRDASSFELPLPTKIDDDVATVKWHRRSHELRLTLPCADQANSSAPLALARSECVVEDVLGISPHAANHSDGQVAEENVKQCREVEEHIVKKRKKKKRKKKSRNLQIEDSSTTDSHLCIRDRLGDGNSCMHTRSLQDPGIDQKLAEFFPAPMSEHDSSSVCMDSSQNRDSASDGIFTLPDIAQQNQSYPYSLGALEQASGFDCYEDLLPLRPDSSNCGNISIRGTFLHISLPHRHGSKYRSKSEGAEPDARVSSLSFERYVNTCHFYPDRCLRPSTFSLEEISGISQVYKEDSQKDYSCIDEGEMSSAAHHSGTDEEGSILSTTQSIALEQLGIERECCQNSSTASTATPSSTDLCTPVGSPHGVQAQLAQQFWCDRENFGEPVRTNSQWPQRNHEPRNSSGCEQDRAAFQTSRRPVNHQSTVMGSGSIVAEMRRRADGEFALATDINTTAAIDSHRNDVPTWRPTLRHLRKNEAMHPLSFVIWFCRIAFP